jgi:hypothetical protein
MEELETIADRDTVSIGAHHARLVSAHLLRLGIEPVRRGGMHTWTSQEHPTILNIDRLSTLAGVCLDSLDHGFAPLVPMPIIRTLLKTRLL